MVRSKGKSLNGTYRVLNGLFYVKNGYITHISRITREGYEVPGYLYISDGPKSRGYTRIYNVESRLFSTVRSGMYKGTYAVN